MSEQPLPDSYFSDASTMRKIPMRDFSAIDRELDFLESQIAARMPKLRALRIPIGEVDGTLDGISQSTVASTHPVSPTERFSRALQSDFAGVNFSDPPPLVDFEQSSHINLSELRHAPRSIADALEPPADSIHPLQQNTSVDVSNAPQPDAAVAQADSLVEAAETQSMVHLESEQAQPRVETSDAMVDAIPEHEENLASIDTDDVMVEESSHAQSPAAMESRSASRSDHSDLGEILFDLEPDISLSNDTQTTEVKPGGSRWTPDTANASRAAAKAQTRSADMDIELDLASLLGEEGDATFEPPPLLHSPPSAAARSLPPVPRISRVNVNAPVEVVEEIAFDDIEDFRSPSSTPPPASDSSLQPLAIPTRDNNR
jgi:hypothetical protein